MDVKFTKTTEKRQKPDNNKLGFGKYFTDYMFEMDYLPGQGWVNPEIKPYGTISIEPSSMVIHYGQTVFEGLKAYLADNGDVLLFRPQKNVERLNKSSARLCIPELDEALAMKAIIEHVKINRDWVPDTEGASLYIRPHVFATEESLGVAPSDSYKFMVISSPVGAYYAEGFSPVKIYVEETYVRAVRGGIGASKAAGNYAASIKAQSVAKAKGYSQVLWLDGVEQKHIEEVGTMNVFFKINDEIVTPELNGSILAGVTRDSVITLLKDFGYKISERKISLEEVITALLNGELQEAFGTGTAAVISPIGEMYYNNESLKVNNGEVGTLTNKLYHTLTGIQSGKIEDKHGWTVKL